MIWGTQMTPAWLIAHTGPKLKKTRKTSAAWASTAQQGVGNNFVDGSIMGRASGINEFSRFFCWQQGNYETLDPEFLSLLRRVSCVGLASPTSGSLRLYLSKRAVCWSWASTTRHWHFSTEKCCVEKFRMNYISWKLRCAVKTLYFSLTSSE